MAMKLTVEHLYEATMTLANIINQRRPMPQKGKYRLARMHAKLLPEWTVVNEQREAFINAYEHKTAPEAPFSVPADKMPEWHEFWTKGLAKEVIEVDVQPMPLSQMMLPGAMENSNGTIEASEIISLDDLIYDDTDVDLAKAA